jgi:hypothetical protein
MKNIYYMIWADALHQTKAKKPNIDNGLRLLLFNDISQF